MLREAVRQEKSKTNIKLSHICTFCCQVDVVALNKQEKIKKNRKTETSMTYLYEVSKVSLSERPSVCARRWGRMKVKVLTHLKSLALSGYGTPVRLSILFTYNYVQIFAYVYEWPLALSQSQRMNRQ